MDIENEFDYLYLLARSDNHLELLQECMDSGMDPNCKCRMLRPRNVQNHAILLAAIYSPEDNLEAIRILINAGADVNLENSEGYTPLHFASIRRKLSVLDLLFRSGAQKSINAKNIFGQTALHFAINTGEDYSPPDISITRRLLDHKDIIIDATDESLITPLILAVESSNLELVELLLSKGANPNVGNNLYKGSCLHCALSFNVYTFDVEYIILKLLHNEACIYRKNDYGVEPIDILLQNIRSMESLRFTKRCLKVIALKYEVSEDLMLKINTIPGLIQFFNGCCEEVRRMKSHYITKSFTLHDFVLRQFRESYFVTPLRQVYAPIMEKLINGFYHEYFYDIFDQISDECLYHLTELVVLSANATNNLGEKIYMKLWFEICKYLSRMDKFNLIVALSNVRISDTFPHFQERGLRF